jgi:hypothetical protein
MSSRTIENEIIETEELILNARELIRPYKSLIMLFVIFIIMLGHILLYLLLSIFFNSINVLIVVLFFLSLNLSCASTIYRLVFNENIEQFLFRNNLRRFDANIENLQNREIDSNDYDVLLQLDENDENQMYKGASESDINRIPFYKILPNDKEKDNNKENDNNDKELKDIIVDKDININDSEEKKIEFYSKELSEELKNTKCSICLTKFKENEIVTTLPCLHKFHREEINKWLKYKCICPVCKLNVFLD